LNSDKFKIGKKFIKIGELTTGLCFSGLLPKRY